MERILPIIDSIRIFFLPYRSDKDPMNGDTKNWQNEYSEPNNPPNSIISNR
jgi:hypothetical protein